MTGTLDFEVVPQQADTIMISCGTHQTVQFWPPVVPLRTVGLIPDGRLQKDQDHETIIFPQLIPHVIRDTMCMKHRYIPAQHGFFPFVFLTLG